MDISGEKIQNNGFLGQGSCLKQNLHKSLNFRKSKSIYIMDISGEKIQNNGFLGQGSYLKQNLRKLLNFRKSKSIWLHWSKITYLVNIGVSKKDLKFKKIVGIVPKVAKSFLVQRFNHAHLYIK